MQQNPPKLLDYVFAWGDMKNPKASFVRSEWNGMERNEKNNFRIFFTFLVWEF